MKNLSQIKAQVLADPNVRVEYHAQEPEFAIARELINARVRAGLTQDQVAARMHTTQSTIARLESGRTLPSMRTLTRYAKATGSHPVITLEMDAGSAKGPGTRIPTGGERPVGGTQNDVRYAD